MEQISEGILIQLTWWDQDVIKYRFTCSNGSFSGQTELYADHDDLSKLAECLTKFPASRADYRDFELGTFDHNCAGGGVRLHFSCRDSVGHSAVDVQLRADHCRVLGEVESVALRIPIEPAAVDSFILQAKSLGTRIGGTAYLLMAN